MTINAAIRALSLLPLITAASCASDSASAYDQGPGTAENFVDVDVHPFFDHLEPYGRWIEVREHGRCWRPYDVTLEWRPYTIGRWAYTDYGWTWHSLEPWGWATPTIRRRQFHSAAAQSIPRGTTGWNAAFAAFRVRGFPTSSGESCMGAPARPALAPPRST